MPSLRDGDRANVDDRCGSTSSQRIRCVGRAASTRLSEAGSLSSDHERVDMDPPPGDRRVRRVGFGSEDRVLAVDGTMVSAPGSLVIEDGRYDLATAVGGEGYAVAWAEYPPADRTVELRFATVSERGDLVGTSLVEILDGIPDFVRIWFRTELVPARLRQRRWGRRVPWARRIRATIARRVDTATNTRISRCFRSRTGSRQRSRSATSRTSAIRRPGRPEWSPHDRSTRPARRRPRQESSRPRTSGRSCGIDERVTNEPRIRHARVARAVQPVGASATLYDVGNPQGKVYVAAWTGDFIGGWDGFDTFPEYVIGSLPTAHPHGQLPHALRRAGASRHGRPRELGDGTGRDRMDHRGRDALTNVVFRRVRRPTSRTRSCPNRF